MRDCLAVSSNMLSRANCNLFAKLLRGINYMLLNTLYMQHSTNAFTIFEKPLGLWIFLLPFQHIALSWYNIYTFCRWSDGCLWLVVSVQLQMVTGITIIYKFKVISINIPTFLIYMKRRWSFEALCIMIRYARRPHILSSVCSFLAPYSLVMLVIVLYLIIIKTFKIENVKTTPMWNESTEVLCRK